MQFNSIPSLGPMSTPYLVGELGVVTMQPFSCTLFDSNRGSTGGAVYSYSDSVGKTSLIVSPSFLKFVAPITGLARDNGMQACIMNVHALLDSCSWLLRLPAVSMAALKLSGTNYLHA